MQSYNKKALDPSVFLSKVELDGLYAKFRKYDQTKSGTGHLSTQSLYDLLQEYGFNPSPASKKRIFEFVEKKNLKQLDFNGVALIFQAVREHNSEDEADQTPDQEYVDAFVALGGGPETEGSIDKAHIIKLIKEEFELEFILEDFIQDLDNTHDIIDFKTFCQLFESQPDFDNNSVASRASRRSFLSYFTKAKQPDHFQVKYKDFLKYCDKLDNKQ